MGDVAEHLAFGGQFGDNDMSKCRRLITSYARPWRCHKISQMGE